ncbi:MAG: acyl-CoA synthetase [Nocardioides alkalitolerans]
MSAPVTGLRADERWWPAHGTPADVPAIEAVPLADRGLPPTTYELLRHAAALRAGTDRDALLVLPDAARWEEPVGISYTGLLDDVHRVANALHRRGVRRTDPVTLLSPNCAELVPALLGAQLAGIAAPVNSGLVADHVARLVERSGSRVAVVASPELGPGPWSTVERLVADGLLDHVLVVRPTRPEGPAPALVLAGATVSFLEAAITDEPADRFVGTPPTADDLASLFHTGGTTGLPKLAAHTHANEVTDAWMVALDDDLADPDARVFAALPLFHVNALVVTLLAPMFRGQGAVWAGPLGYRDLDLYGCIWRLVERYDVGTMSAVPTVYAVLSQVPVDADLSRLRFAVVGAAVLPPAVRRAFEEHTGVPLLEGYGLTEGTCASLRSYTALPRPGSVGHRLPYQRVRTVRTCDDGSRVDTAPGEQGTLLVAGPTVFPGYVVGRDAHGPVLDHLGTVVDGWLDTGDLARIDAEGFVHLTGRAKDVIIRGGHNIDPVVVEDALLAHPGVAGAGAVGAPDEHAGEVPVAFVVLAPGAEATETELVTWAADHVAERAAAPRRVTVVPDLPLTDVGKPSKLPLRAWATAAVLRDLLPAADVVAVDAVVEDGTVVAVVTAADAAALVRVDTVLERLPVVSRVEVAP